MAVVSSKFLELNLESSSVYSRSQASNWDAPTMRRRFRCRHELGIVLAQNGHIIPTKLDCIFREERPNEGVGAFGPIVITRKALLLVGDVDTNEKAIIFKVKESSLDILQYVDMQPNDLECEISRYSTGDIYVPWPHQGEGSSEDVWFMVTMKHKHGKFTVTSFLRKLKAPDQEDNGKSQTPTEDEDSPIGNTDTLLVQVSYIIHTSTPSVRTKLKQDFILDCGYKIDHSTGFKIDWRYQYRGVKKKLFIYNGWNEQIEHIDQRVQPFLDQIKNGNASLRIKNIGMNDEGPYTCLVYVPPLFGTHTINLEIMRITVIKALEQDSEPPRVYLSHNSLSLTEGDEQKLACDMEMFYPLDVTVKWQRQKDGEHLLPVYMTNTILSSHKPNRDGTFNLTSYFRFSASLEDNGATFVCQVDHVSLEKTIKRYVHINVKAQSQILLYILISTLFLFSCVILIILLIHLNKVTDKTKHSLKFIGCRLAKPNLHYSSRNCPVKLAVCWNLSEEQASIFGQMSARIEG
ncbi:tapasin-related protein-like [Narcine bancroftii]|uniref:tapasin-related protein-like n=1 Tax=Narcine bancroftii TaxID=1343680 RepID=UPI0038320BD9